MNARERTLLIVLLAILGGGAVLYAGIRQWWEPLQDYNRTIQAMQEENDEKNFQKASFHQERKKLALARLRSLPSKPEQAAAEYMARLEPILQESGLAVEDFTKTGVKKASVVTPIANVKAVGHQIVTFTVRARGSLEQFVKAMEQMQRSPYEHRIRSLTIDRIDAAIRPDADNKLTVQLIIETLLVAGTDKKGSLPSGIDAKGLGAALRADRNYADIARKNIFVGALPALPKKKPPVEVAKEEPDEPLPERPEENTPAYIYLTQTSPDQHTAYLRNRIYGGPEKKLIADKPGYQEFQVTDEVGGFLFFRAKVLKVEQQKMYFQIGRSLASEFPRNSVFLVQIGQSLAEARDFSFNRSRIDLIDDELYDEEFEQSETAKDKQGKKDNKGKATGKKGAAKR